MIHFVSVGRRLSDWMGAVAMGNPEKNVTTATEAAPLIPLLIRVPAATKARVEALARAQQRSVSRQGALLLEEALAGAGELEQTG
jgi:hypothetical protein